MDISVRRLGAGDEAILQLLAREDADFDVDGRSNGLKPLASGATRDYLSDPCVLIWVAESAGQTLGFLFCYLLKMRAEPAREVLLYEIGVRASFRRSGIGRALQDTLEAWMGEQGVSGVWVLADNPGAVDFYKSCGFEVNDEMAIYMTRSIDTRP